MTSMLGKTVVVTGASAGIGAASARQLHQLGATVVPVGRSPEKTAAVAAEIGVEPWLADFTRLSEVRALAGKLTELPRIDVLLNNAGGTWPTSQITEDGYERTFQVNHLAPYLLTRLLQDTLIASTARVVTTSSAVHGQGRINLENLDSAGEFTGMRAYANSKLANVLFAVELQRRWGPEGVQATCAHPGVVGSDFGRDSAVVGAFYRLARPFLTSPRKGAETLVWLASEPQSAGWQPGGYHAKQKVAAVSPAGRNGELARELWIRSAELVGLPAD